MWTRAAHGWLAVVLLAVGLGYLSDSRAADDSDFAAVANELAPAVVRITGYMRELGSENSYQTYGEASGFFIDREGYLLSVAHPFIDRSRDRLCERFQLELHDGRRLTAQLHALDPVLNLAIFRAEEPADYPTVRWSSGASAKPGMRVLALSGGKLDGEEPYSLGRLKARPRKQSLYKAGFADILMNVRIKLPARGYGGPLVNRLGEVIGINTGNIHLVDPESADPEEQHALPMGTVMTHYRVLTAYPSFERPWLGVKIEPVAMKRGVGLFWSTGIPNTALVDYVWQDSPAGRAGIQKGDILLGLGGKRLMVTNLDWLLYEAGNDATIDLELMREGRHLTKRVSLEKRPLWSVPR